MPRIQQYWYQISRGNSSGNHPYNPRSIYISPIASMVMLTPSFRRALAWRSAPPGSLQSRQSAHNQPTTETDRKRERNKPSRNHPPRTNNPLPGHIPGIKKLVTLRRGEVFQTDAYLARTLGYLSTIPIHQHHPDTKQTIDWHI